MTEREKLAQDLADWSAKVDDYEHVVLKSRILTYWLHVADFVINDRKRIVDRFD